MSNRKRKRGYQGHRMSDARLLASARSDLTRSRANVVGDEMVIVTDPGCDHPLHREEVQGAMMALHTHGPWPGRTDMDCGCVLSLQRASSL